MSGARSYQIFLGLLAVFALAVLVYTANRDRAAAQEIVAPPPPSVAAQPPSRDVPTDPELVIRTEVPSGRWVSWWTGSGPPSNRPVAGLGCVTGSLYTRTDGTAGSTLYICEEGRWSPK